MGRGKAEATLELEKACIDIAEECGPITVRGVGYKLFTRGLIDSMSVANMQKVSGLVTDLRETGELDCDLIADDTRRRQGQPKWGDLYSMAPDIVRSYSRDFWKHQDNNVMVINEKSTIAGVVMPVLDELGVKFLSAKGFCSATAVHDLAEDIANDGRFTTILYIGDWDPSGLYMSEVDFPARLGKYGAGLFHFERIALSRDDCVEMAQTPFPAKEKDRRYAWFAARSGKQCWELDALDPNDLRDRVRAAVWEYIDEDEWNHNKLAEAAEISTLKTFVGGWQEALRQQGKD